jgi:hypothetical protein
LNTALAEALLAILRAHPDGLSEHDLIRKLAHADPAFGPTPLPTNCLNCRFNLGSNIGVNDGFRHKFDSDLSCIFCGSSILTN